MEPHIFWEFLDLDCDEGKKKKCFSLAAFTACAAGSNESFSSLLRAQNSAVDYFYEKLRPNAGIAFAKARLPGFLHMDSLDPHQWPLVCIIGCWKEKALTLSGNSIARRHCHMTHDNDNDNYNCQMFARVVNGLWVCLYFPVVVTFPPFPFFHDLH